MNKNTKLILMTVGGILLLVLYVNRPKDSGGSKALREKSLFEVAEQIENPNKVQRGPIEDAGTMQALDQKSEAEPKPASAKKSLWDEADKAPSAQKEESSQVHGEIATEPNHAPSAANEAVKRPQSGSREDLPAHRTPAGVKLVSIEKAPDQSEQTPSGEAAQPTGGGRKRSSMADLMEMSAPSTTRVSGRDTMADGNLLQEGSAYLGVIEDPIRAVEGEPQQVAISIIGKLSSNSVAVPFKMTGIATLNKDKTRVRVEIKRCVDARSSARSVDCAGTVGDIEGWDGIGGQINSPGIWGTLIRTASVLGSQMALSKMTSSVTQTGILMDQTQSNAVLQSLSEAFQSLGNDLAEKIESKGTNIVVAGQSIVRIRITKDSPLW